MTKPRLLFYCQHSLGLGHLARSLALAGGLADRFDVVLLNGGRLPAGTRAPDGVSIVNLPPLGHDAQRGLVSHDPKLSSAQAQVKRRDRILRTFAELVPQVVVIELYPFGRKKFEFELLPLLDAIVSLGSQRPTTVCSLRDILVNGRDNQVRHDDRASRRANAFFDAILVHSDPTFARLDDTFKPETPLTIPVYYTGFVAPPRVPKRGRHRQQRLIVSAGGGMVGEPLFRAAVRVHRDLIARTGLSTTVVAGPFLPARTWRWLQREATRSPALTVLRQVPDLAQEMGDSAVSLSQGGYNTTMDILRSGTPSVVVPYAEGNEDEQQRRTARLAALGAVRVVSSTELSGDRLLDELCAAVRFRPSPVTFDLTGVSTSARIVAEIAGPR
jgi:predicted glycosyltransferase